MQNYALPCHDSTSEWRENVVIGAALVALAAGLSLPSPQTLIAMRVAGDGMPNCQQHEIDGTVSPCIPRFRIGAGVHVNARSEGQVISFTRAAVTQLTVDEFALLAGHEVAHYYLGHRASTHANELAADQLGAELACKAGYNPAAGVTLFRHLATGKSHPKPSARRAVVLASPCERPSG